MKVDLTMEEILVLAEYHSEEAKRTGNDSTKQGKAHWLRNEELFSARRAAKVQEMEGVIHNASQGDDSRTSVRL